MVVLNRRTNGFTAVWVASVVLHRPLMISVLAATVSVYHVMVVFCTTATAYVVNVQVLPVTAVTPTPNVAAGEYCEKSTMLTDTFCAPALRASATDTTIASSAATAQPRWCPVVVVRTAAIMVVV